MHKASKVALITLLAASSILAGCASNTPTFNQYEKQFENEAPTTQWLEENVNDFREKAWEEPTEDNVKTFALVKELLDDRLRTKSQSENWQAQTHRTPTLDCIKEERGGAAFRQAGYKHVVANEAFEPGYAKTACSKTIKPAQLTVNTDKTFNKLANKDLSIYSMNSWKKYCNNGEGMTKADWDYIEKVGIHNIPKALVGKCYPPK